MNKILFTCGRFVNNFFQMWRIAVPAYATVSARGVLYHDGHCGDEECGTTDKEEDNDEECCGGGGCGGDDCGCDK